MPGDRLPAVRDLARRCGVSPATVASAYRELHRRGIASGSGRAGTRIRPRPPVRTRLSVALPPGVQDLRNGQPDPALLPALPCLAPSCRLYGEPGISPRLLRVAVERLSADGLSALDVAVVGGALDGVERVLAAWTKPGDKVAVEDPGYAPALDLLAAMGLDALPVPVDEMGARPEAVAAALARGAGAVLLTPRAQNPTGAAWSPERVAELREVLAGHEEVLLVEDDHAGPVAGSPAYSLGGVTSRWAMVRSVSKWLGPDYRLAVLSGDAATVARVEGRQALGPGWVSYMLQDAVAALWADSEVTSLLERAAATYTARRQSLHAELAAVGLAVTGRTGLATWVPVDDESGTVAGLLAKGWAVTPGERFRTASPPAIRISHAALSHDMAAALARDLADVLGRPEVRLG